MSTVTEGPRMPLCHPKQSDRPARRGGSGRSTRDTLPSASSRKANSGRSAIRAAGGRWAGFTKPRSTGSGLGRTTNMNDFCNHERRAAALEAASSAGPGERELPTDSSETFRLSQGAESRLRRKKSMALSRTSFRLWRTLAEFGTGGSNSKNGAAKERVTESERSGPLWSPMRICSNPI